MRQQPGLWATTQMDLTGAQLLAGSSCLSYHNVHALLAIMLSASARHLQRSCNLAHDHSASGLHKRCLNLCKHCRYYGFPAFDHASMKIGKFGHRGEWSSPDTLDRTIYPEDEEVTPHTKPQFLRSCWRILQRTPHLKLPLDTIYHQGCLMSCQWLA